jgi:hypothetical protein
MPLGAFKAALMGTAGATAAADVVLLSTSTASNASAVSITSGLDSTYKEYIFGFYNIHARTDNQEPFGFQVSVDGGSNYGVAKTTHVFQHNHAEDDSDTDFQKQTSYNLGNGTGVQGIAWSQGNGADENFAGLMHLWNPASTTYVKNFYVRTNNASFNNYVSGMFTAGYVNTTSAVNAIQFTMNSGNFDGKIKLWGVK